MSRMHVSAVLAFVIGSALALDARAAVTPDQVLVVVNDASAISVAVGSYYARVRGIPPGNVFHLPVGTPTTEAIYRSIYNTQIRNPLLAHLTVTRPDLRDRIRYLVLTKGVPHAIVNVSGRGLSQDCASVDSELTQLFTGRVPDDGQKGWVPNPYFDARVPFDTFSHPDLSYLVFRLDGYQSNVDPETGVPADIERLIDDSQRPAAFGRFVLDAKNPSGEGDDWIQAAADRLRARRIPVVHEPGRAAFAKNVDGILGYCSWGSNDPSNPGPPFFGEVPLGGGDVYPGTFLPGSVATCFVSTDARTLVNGRQWYSQSLIADLIHMGATAVNGHAFEPYLDGVARPEILFPAYLDGFQVGEALYQSIPCLSWQNVVVCDPLMVSAIAPPPPPRIQSIDPQCGSPGGGTIITIGGEGFAADEAISVRVGGTPCTSVVPVSAQMLIAITPPGAPGPADVTIEAGATTTTLARGFAYTPAVAVSGQPRPGDALTFTMWGRPGDRYYVLTSLGTAEIPLPPCGIVRLDPGRGLMLLFSGFLTAPRLDIPVRIPDDMPQLGVTMHAQALVGIHLDGESARLSNVLSVSLP